LELRGCSTFRCAASSAANEKPERSNGEHPFSVAIGGSWTVPDICEECDNRFGTTFDADLVKFTPIEKRREELQLAGHAGTTPNRLREALRRPMPVVGGGGRTVLVSMNQQGRITGTKTIPLAKFRFNRAADGEVVVSLPPENVAIDPTNVHDVQRMLALRLHKDAEEADIPLSDEQVDYLAAHFASDLERIEEDTTVEVALSVRMHGHLGSLAKIAYVAAWTWLGDTWLDDSVANAMRQYLMGDESARLVGRDKPSVQRELDLGGRDPKQTHVAMLLRVGGAGVVYVQVFDVVSAEFVVTEDVGRYAPPQEHAIVLDAVKREHRFVDPRTLLPDEAARGPRSD
jgi:hypothetical protein